MNDVQIEEHQVKNTLGQYNTIIGKKPAYISITNWHNGEGWDVSIYDGDHNQIFTLDIDSWNALKKTMKKHLSGPMNATDDLGVEWRRKIIPELRKQGTNQ